MLTDCSTVPRELLNLLTIHPVHVLPAKGCIIRIRPPWDMGLIIIQAVFIHKKHCSTIRISFQLKRNAEAEESSEAVKGRSRRRLSCIWTNVVLCRSSNLLNNVRDVPHFISSLITHRGEMSCFRCCVLYSFYEPFSCCNSQEPRGK